MTYRLALSLVVLLGMATYALATDYCVAVDAANMRSGPCGGVKYSANRGARFTYLDENQYLGSSQCSAGSHTWLKLRDIAGSTVWAAQDVLGGCSGGGGDGGGDGGSNAGGDTLSECAVASAFSSQGWSGQDLATLVCTAKYESSWQRTAVNRGNSNGSWDWGILQINDYYWCGRNGVSGDCNLACSDLLGSNGPQLSARCAKLIKSRHGFEAWYAYRSHRSECASYRLNC